MIEQFLNKTINDVELEGLSNSYSGKVRRSYDAPGERKVIIATDRLSAFDRQITTIPLKGQVLTQLSRFWFDQTKDICPNHIVAYPDPNVAVCRSLNMLPVELVVRGYLAGSTATSILKMYKAGRRDMYGVSFPEGLRDNQKLEKPIVTPTTKASGVTHDEPLTPQKILDENILDAKTWETVKSYALALFARGQEIAHKQGLILADTKYEFGIDADGVIVLGDEIHTPDSSRYWIASSYPDRFAANEAPEALDKDVVRRWVAARCDPYKDDVPKVPDDIRLETARAYLSVYEKMTGTPLSLPDPSREPSERIQTNIKNYLRENP